jgi:hypothetical protein
MTVYVLMSLAGADGELRVLTQVNEVEGTTVEFDGRTVPADAMRFDVLGEAAAAGAAIMGHNREFNPPLNLVLGEAREFDENGRCFIENRPMGLRLKALLLPAEPTKTDRLVRSSGLRYGLTVKRLDAPRR